MLNMSANLLPSQGEDGSVKSRSSPMDLWDKVNDCGPKLADGGSPHRMDCEGHPTVVSFASSLRKGSREEMIANQQFADYYVLHPARFMEGEPDFIIYCVSGRIKACPPWAELLEPPMHRPGLQEELIRTQQGQGGV